jgi:hypothetical protein
MDHTIVKSGFDSLKKTLKAKDPEKTLTEVGAFAERVLTLLAGSCQWADFAWKGKGTKTYRTFVPKQQEPGQSSPAKALFSRASNVELFIADPSQYRQSWNVVLEALQAGRAAKARTLNCAPSLIDRAVYTAVIAFASATDLYYPGDKGRPGALFETAVGAAISMLTGLSESRRVELGIPGEAAKVVVESEVEDESGDDRSTDEEDDLAVSDVGANANGGPIEDKAVIQTDRWFPGNPKKLVVAMKISSRERISQVSVQQLLLERIAPGQFRSILCACNENNVMCQKGTDKADRTPEKCWLVDTLVPRTISLYHRFIAEFKGLYYLDPPTPYVDGTYAAEQAANKFPAVKPLHQLFTVDLPDLLGSLPEEPS